MVVIPASSNHLHSTVSHISHPTTSSICILTLFLQELKKLMNQKLGLNVSKIKRPNNGSKWLFACFQNEEDKNRAITALNGYSWKGLCTMWIMPFGILTQKPIGQYVFQKEFFVTTKSQLNTQQLLCQSMCTILLNCKSSLASSRWL